MNAWLRAAAAIGFGLLAWLGFPPVSLPMATLGGLAGLFGLLATETKAPYLTSALHGALWSLAFYLPLVAWMRAIDPMAWMALAVGLVVIQTLGALASRMVMTLPWWQIWLALVWTATETARSYGPFGGFSWGRLAFTTVDTPMLGWVRWLSIAGTSFLVALAAALLATAVLGPGLRTRLGALVASVSLVVGGLLVPLGVSTDAPTRTVAVVQGGVPSADFSRWPPGKVAAMHIGQTALLDQPVDFIFWPESSSDLDPTLSPVLAYDLSALSASKDAPLIMGALLRGPEPGTLYNASVVWTPDGLQGTYVKRHPVAWGEYLPFRKQLGDGTLHFARRIPADMIAGTEPGVFVVDGTPMGVAICWDVAFDSSFADAVDSGAELLVVQTSNAAFQGTDQLEQQWQIERIRAVETDRWVLVPSTSGITGVVDPSGHVVARLALLNPGTLVEKVGLHSGRTPAVRYGAAIEDAIVVVAVLAVVVARMRVRKSASSSGGEGAAGRSHRHEEGQDVR